MSVTSVRKQAVAQPSERQGLEHLAELLSVAGASIAVGDERFALPDGVRRALADLAARLGRGEVVVLASTDELLTTSEAADMLGISRTYLCRLLDRDELKFTHRGTHRRVSLGDALAYRDKMASRRSTALDKVASISREAGLYDDDF